MSRRGWRIAAVASCLVAVWLSVLAPTIVIGAESPSPPRLDVDGTSGPPGTVVGIPGDGFAAGNTYGLCILPSDQVQCGYYGVELGSFAADPAGRVPSGVSGRIPNLLAGSFHIVATAPGTGAIVAGTAFTVARPGLT